MYGSTLRIYVHGTILALLLAAGTYGVAAAVRHPAELILSLPQVLALVVPAAIAARLGAPRESVRPIRLAMAFVLAGLALLPPPGGLLVGLAAVAAGGGGGVAARPRRGGGVSFTSVLTAVALAQAAAGPLARLVQAGPLGSLLHLSLLFALVQGAGLAVEALLVGRRGAAAGPARGARAVLAEGAAVLLGWTLAEQLRPGSWASYASLSSAVLLGGFALRRWDRALHDLRRVNESLAARATELATLHSIGREILSSLDPAQVYRIVERECRKLFDVDLFFIAVVDRETEELRGVYRRQRGELPADAPHPLDEGLVSWVVEEKRGLRVADLREPSGDPPLRVPDGGREIRSALAVPLVVENRVTGVLSVQSRRPRAYDDDHLSVLVTIAQQAAVALENARHYEMATIDSLTGLYLRDYFFRRLEEEHNRARRYGGSFAVLMLDLDGFKEINDRHGHLAGDRYLRALGPTLRAGLRAADLACRYGGDEFCLLLPETDLAGARVIAERIREAVSRLLVKADQGILRTTMSIGLAAFPTHDTGELKVLLRKADQALYEAKRAGRDRVVPFAA